MSNPLDDLKSLYGDIDQQTSRLVEIHGPRLVCRRGCSMCCVDELTVFEVEAQNIRQSHLNLLQTAVPHAPGACAFLDADGACRIYEDRPYVCRTQGLPLRWLEEEASGDFIELRDICPLNDEGDVEPIEELPQDECWSIGPTEERLAKLQLQFGQGKLTRIPLRSLFQLESE
ncbi:MAG: YkgJ family cysteine cluster protein [Planctomycetota bacterium]